MTIGQRIDRAVDAIKGVLKSCFCCSDEPKGLVIGNPTNFVHVSGDSQPVTSSEYLPLSGDDQRRLLASRSRSAAASSEAMPRFRLVVDGPGAGTSQQAGTSSREASPEA